MKPKTIHRTAMNSDFTVLPNATLRDKRLSFRARGLLAMMLTNREDWETNCHWMQEQVPENSEGESAASLRLAVEELEHFGYLRKTRTRGSDGKIDAVVWEWSDSPLFETPQSALPYSRKPKCGNLHTKKNQGNEERSEKKKQEKERGVLVPRTTSFSENSPEFLPSYPTSEEEMYEVLDSLGIETTPDYDGNFYSDATRWNWIDPRTGRKIRNWPAFYDARTNITFPGKEVHPVVRTQTGKF